MRRRDFVTLVAAAAAGQSLGWPHGGWAQDAAMPVIGLLSATQIDELQLRAFRQGLAEAGYAEGRNVTIEFRSANGEYDRLPALAADLVARRVNVIAALYTPLPAVTAKAATATIPIVFGYGGDPVADGLVASLNRPGGNVTGATFVTAALMAKRLELMRELVPKAGVIGILVNPDNRLAETQLKDVREAARLLGQPIHVVKAGSDRDFDAAYDELVRVGASGLVVGTDSIFYTRRDRLIALEVRLKIPTIYTLREYVAAGGLMSYGASIVDMNRQAGVYAGRILKGARPNDLPVVQPTKFDFAINLNTAKTLAWEIPQKLLALADEVIE